VWTQLDADEVAEFAVEVVRPGGGVGDGLDISIGERLQASGEQAQQCALAGAGFAGDEVLATAILDRLLHRSHVLKIKGRSYWLRDLEQAASLLREQPPWPRADRQIKARIRRDWQGAPDWRGRWAWHGSSRLKRRAVRLASD
jgi:hypothetical protein